MGNSIAIIIGQLLGAGELEKAIDEDRKLIAFAVALCAAVGVVMALLAPLIPEIYNTSGHVKQLASELLLVSAVMMPVNAFTNSCYFTLRSGGKTIITFLFDCGFVWCGNVVVAYVLTHFTNMHIVPIYFCCKMVEIIKCVIGFVLVKKGSWMKNIVGGEEAPVAQEA